QARSGPPTQLALQALVAACGSTAAYFDVATRRQPATSIDAKVVTECESQQQLRSDMNSARALGVHSAPAVFVNGTRLLSLDEDSLALELANEVRAARHLAKRDRLPDAEAARRRLQARCGSSVSFEAEVNASY